MLMKVHGLLIAAVQNVNESTWVADYRSAKC